jgi:hypothetical protein
MAGREFHGGQNGGEALQSSHRRSLPPVDTVLTQLALSRATKLALSLVIVGTVGLLAWGLLSSSGSDTGVSARSAKSGAAVRPARVGGVIRPMRHPKTRPQKRSGNDRCANQEVEQVTALEDFVRYLDLSKEGFRYLVEGFGLNFFFTAKQRMVRREIWLIPDRPGRDRRLGWASQGPEGAVDAIAFHRLLGPHHAPQSGSLGVMNRFSIPPLRRSGSSESGTGRIVIPRCQAASTTLSTLPQTPL